MRRVKDERNRAPISLGEALLRVISDLGLERRVDEERLKLLWPGIVGEKLSRVSHVVRVNRGRFLVRVRSAPWRNEMIFLKGDIIGRINRSLGKNFIKDISFVLGEEDEKDGR